MPLACFTASYAQVPRRAIKLSDGSGLFLFICWRVIDHFQGREKLTTLGTSLQLLLKETREVGITDKKRLSGGVDPGAEKRL